MKDVVSEESQAPSELASPAHTNSAILIDQRPKEVSILWKLNVY